MATPESTIEIGRRILQEREQLANTCQEIFRNTIEILGDKGTIRGIAPLKFRSLTCTVNSTEPPIAVRLYVGGANLARASSVRISVEGINEVLCVERKVKKGKEIFSGKIQPNVYPRYSRNLDLREASGYLAAIKQLTKELS